MSNKLDKFEQSIESEYDKHKSVRTSGKMQLFRASAKAHLKKKKSITIRVAEQDIEAIKLKASKLGLAYQTYLNMLIHLDATKL